MALGFLSEEQNFMGPLWGVRGTMWENGGSKGRTGGVAEGSLDVALTMKRAGEKSWMKTLMLPSSLRACL